MNDKVNRPVGSKLNAEQRFRLQSWMAANINQDKVKAARLTVSKIGELAGKELGYSVPSDTLTKLLRFMGIKTNVTACREKTRTSASARMDRVEKLLDILFEECGVNKPDLRESGTQGSEKFVPQSAGI